MDINVLKNFKKTKRRCHSWRKSHMAGTQKKFREEAAREITEYVEIFYNRQRRQEKHGYLSPAAFERSF